MPTEYTAQILELQLPEQEELKDESERCSADPATLKSIGRAIGQQVRITRCDSPNFVAVYTVKQSNPDDDLGDPELANVVRTGQPGRERLGTAEQMAAIVQAQVVDDPPQPGRASFFELIDDDGKQAYFIAIAPHGGGIEPHTDKQPKDVVTELKAASLPASFWLCNGGGDKDKGAFDRWHITSEDIQPACFPLLQPLALRTFCYGVAFHGFDRKEDEADVYIGGGASLPLKRAVERALNDLNLPIEVRISTGNDKPKFQGFSPANIINRLATRGIQLEQSVCHELKPPPCPRPSGSAKVLVIGTKGLSTAGISPLRTFSRRAFRCSSPWHCGPSATESLSMVSIVKRMKPMSISAEELRCH